MWVGGPLSPAGNFGGGGGILGCAQSAQPPPARAGAAPRAAAGSRAPPGAAREPGVAAAAARCGLRGRPAGPGWNRGQRGAWPRPRRPGERAAGRETSLPSYLHDRAHRGASKQLALGAHPKYPDNGFPVLSALDLRSLGFSPGGHHENLGVWGNRLLESLDDVSRCDFDQRQTTRRAPRPARPAAARQPAPLRGEGAAGGGSPRGARALAPPSITSPALRARLPESSAQRAGGAARAGCASPRRPWAPAPCPPGFGAAEALSPQ